MLVVEHMEYANEGEQYANEDEQYANHNLVLFVALICKLWYSYYNLK